MSGVFYCGDVTLRGCKFCKQEARDGLYREFRRGNIILLERNTRARARALHAEVF